jgi:hypothetical protein
LTWCARLPPPSRSGPHQLRISIRIVNEGPGGNRVVYDITSKAVGQVHSQTGGDRRDAYKLGGRGRAGEPSHRPSAHVHFRRQWRIAEWPEPQNRAADRHLARCNY